MSDNTTDTHCATCGEPIYDEDSHNRNPCPKCGALSRTYSLTANVTVSVSVSAEAKKISLPQSLLDTARAMIDSDIDGLPAMAVILCHAACEIATDRALEAGFKANQIEHLHETIRKRFRSNRMGTKETHQLYTALTGDDIKNTPFWKQYTASIKRRDEIAHSGRMIGKDEAEETHKAATALVKHLCQ
jgi:uncharacterized Zn finger protein (UPF0148 family)